MTSLAAIYHRVSTGDQENSLGIQSEKIRKYFEFKSLHALPETSFEDEEASGGLPIQQRPKGAHFMRLLQTGHLPGQPLGLSAEPIRHAVITVVDRLGRDATDLLQFWDFCVKKDITLHIVDFFGEPLTSRGMLGRYFYGQMALNAELELAMIRKRTQDTVDSLFAQNRLISGNIPYGWDPVDHEGNIVEPITYTGYPDGTRFTPDPVDRRGRPAQPVDMFKWPDGTRLVENPLEAEWLRKMHQKRERHGWSPNKIAQWLNHQGVPTKEGLIGRWQTGNVKRVLTSKHATKLLNTETPDRGSASRSPTGKDAFHSVPEN